MLRPLLLLVSAILPCLAVAQQNLLPLMATKGNALVLAKVVGRKAADPGRQWRRGQEDAQDTIEWSTVELESIDCYLGHVPKRFGIAVPKSLVDQADLFFTGKVAGGTGRGPMEGLQLGDIAVWSVQRVQPEGWFYLSGMFAPMDSNPDTANVFTAPGQELAMADMSSARPILLDGKFLSDSRSRVIMPATDRTLQTGRRYADLIIRTSAAHIAAAQTEYGVRRWYELLVGLRGQLLKPGHAAVPAVTDEATLVDWLDKMLVDSLPQRNDEDRLNNLAVRMHSEKAERLEADFIQLLHKLGREKLLAPMPGIESADYHIAECEGTNGFYAAQSFTFMTSKPPVGPRALRAAIQWLDVLLADPERYKEANSYGLPWRIVCFVPAATERPDIRKAFQTATLEDMRRAKQIAEEYLRKK